MPHRAVSKPDKASRKIKRPPPEFGERALQLAESVGKSRADLMEVTGRSGPSTFERLQKGKGSMAFAASVKAVLGEWGADVSKLPPLDGEPSSTSPAWKTEWLAIGETLHRLATPERFEQEMDKLRRLVDAHRVIAGELVEISRPNVSDDKPRR